MNYITKKIEKKKLVNIIYKLNNKSLVMNFCVNFTLKLKNIFYLKKYLKECGII